MFESSPELQSIYLTGSYDNAKWGVVQIHAVPLMSREEVVAIVRTKELKARDYRSCDAYWLLGIVDFIDPAQEQEIRVDFDAIGSDVFEKIIIYKPRFNHIVEAK
jgi:hypothetical protein